MKLAAPLDNQCATLTTDTMFTRPACAAHSGALPEVTETTGRPGDVVNAMVVPTPATAPCAAGRTSTQTQSGTRNGSNDSSSDSR